MKLRNPLIAITASVSLLFLAECTSPLIYSSIWQNKPVTIDGKATEWKIPLDYFDDKTKLNFSITNDKTNIYFCVRATEDETQKGIIQTGLQIWIDTTGGKKNQVGIQFPIIPKSATSSGASTRHSQSSESSGNPENSPETTASSAHGLKAKYAGMPRQIMLSGFTNVTNGLAEEPNMFGINACLNWDTNNIMIYEVCIPFNTFYKASLFPSDSNKVLGISFSVTTTTKNNGGHGGGGAGGMGGAGMRGGAGGMGGGGMGGGGGHGGGHGGGGGGSTTETLTAHVKIKLAVGESKL